MALNPSKSKNMIINFTRKYQFGTRLEIDGKNIEIVKSAKILGTIITDDLSWDDNCAELVRKANARMVLLRKVDQFGASEQDKKLIYITFVRNCLEQSAVVFTSSLTQENREDLERLQRNAVRIIDKNYKSYEDSLLKLNLKTLLERRNFLSLKFAKKCITHPKMKIFFPLNNTHTGMETRHSEKFLVTHANTERFKISAIPFMQRLLNDDYRKHGNMKHDKKGRGSD